METKRFKRALFIFRRDLRLQDNTALNSAAAAAETIIPSFIFDPRQTERHRFRSSNALQFMIESLRELEQELLSRGGRLHYFLGKPDIVVEQLIDTLGIEAVFVNSDYTPFAKERDDALCRVCKSRGVEFHSCADVLLNEPGKVIKKDGTPYTVFTPFHRAAVRLPVARPIFLKRAGFFNRPIPEALDDPWQHIECECNPRLFVHGGRSSALAVLKGLSGYKNYAAQRDFPAQSATTGLSAHNKFGTVSIREVYWAVAEALGADHPLLRQLYWRDFFTHVACHFPHVFGRAFHRKYDALKWNTSNEAFSAWSSGHTGFPLIDAGMRELNSTGFMHNRVRMITASFLTKDLQNSWQEGELDFASKLVDYDPCVNNGNWQWSASTGCDAQPYFRIFNPQLQQKRYDPDGEYVRRWVPELSKLSGREILKLYQHDASVVAGYPEPMVDHQEAKTKAEEMFSSLDDGE